MKKPTKLDVASVAAYYAVVLGAIAIVLAWMRGVGVGANARTIVVVVMAALYWFHRYVDARAVAGMVAAAMVKGSRRDRGGVGASVYEPGDVASRCAHPGEYCGWVRPCSPEDWPEGPWFCHEHCPHGHGTDALGHCRDCDEGIVPEHGRAT